jgi:NADPH2:quinone reductase
MSEPATGNIDTGATMRAAVYRRRGPAHDVLEVVDVPIPSPGPGEVRVRVHVSGVNPTDWKARSGDRPMTFDFQVPNQDGAGVIDAVGDGVDSARVGEHVWLYFAAWRRQFGTAAEYTCVPEDQAVKMPDEIPFELGASVGIPAMTAHRCLFADGDIGGRTVLVAGGAGAVGHAAIQLARRAGATVITTVSGPEKAEIARAAGAHHVVNYREPGAADRIKAIAPDGVDRVVEVALATNIALNLAVMGPNASIACYADDDGDATIPSGDLMGKNTNLRFVLVYTMSPDAIRAAVDHTTAALADGTLATLPLHRFPLDRIADAHQAVEQGAVGKVVVDLTGQG